MQQAQIEKLTALVAELEAKLVQSSRNSSKPPSSDGPGVVKGKQKPSGRKPGGQPGHEGHSREWFSPEAVDETKQVVPESCDECHGPVIEKAEGPPDVRQQMVDIPPIKPLVTEHVLLWRWCEKCQKWTLAKLPKGVPAGAFGPNLLSLVALLSGQYRLSKRLVQDLLSTVLGIDLSLGSVCRAEAVMSAAMAPAVEEARVYVRNSDEANLDETGWRQRRAKAWLWVAVSRLVTVFLVSLSRGAGVAKDMLGEGFTGFLLTDRWCAYNWYDLLLRQLCWSHLARDFQGMVDRADAGTKWGRALLAESEKMFKWWAQVKDGTLTRSVFERRMVPVEAEVGRLLRKASVCDAAKTSGMATEILKLESALFTFVGVEGIEPTNNAAERAIRHAVLWRKGSFGTHSEAGSRYVERILTVVQTCRAQKRGVFQFLIDTINAHLCGLAPPSLLPGHLCVS